MKFEISLAGIVGICVVVFFYIVFNAIVETEAIKTEAAVNMAYAKLLEE